MTSLSEALARSDDPATSKEAARRAKDFADRHEGRIFAALIAQGRANAYDIADTARLEVSAVFRRLKELQRLRLIELTGMTTPSPYGRPCREWRIKRKG